MYETEKNAYFFLIVGDYFMQMSSKKMQSQKKIPTTLGTTVTASTGTNKNRNTE